MKNIIAMLVLVLAGAITVYLVGITPRLNPDNSRGGIAPDLDETIVRYFAERLEGRFLSLVGQPIEGFAPEMFMQVWLGLEKADFDGVESVAGHYEYQNSELRNIERPDAVITSADQAITGWGMRKLLDNVSRRMDVQIRNGDDVDRLLAALLRDSEGGNTATIRGKVSVGPICPVEREGVPCPVPPEAYTSRGIILFAKDGRTVRAETNFKSDGTYEFKVPAGEYVLDIKKAGIDSASDLPQHLRVRTGEILDINFQIDTGIR